MSTTRRHPGYAAKHLDVYEGWKADHEDAMRCYDLEAWLHQGLCVFEILTGEDESNRTAVFLGLLNSDEAETIATTLYERWLQTAQSGLTELTRCESKFGSVKRADEFWAAIETAARNLTQRSPQKLALALGSRLQELDADESTQLNQLLEAPPGAPGLLTREPQAVPTGSASLIR